MKIISNEENTQFDLGIIDFGSGCDSMTIRFANPSVWDTATLDVISDGKIIGISMLTSTDAEKENVAVSEIDLTQGTHHITFRCNKALKAIYDVTFSSGKRYLESDYIPTDAKHLIDSNSEMWEADDMLGRHIASAEDTRAKKDKKVGVFYWSWRDAHANREPLNLLQTLKEHPAAEYNWSHPAWGDGSRINHWNEPFYGFYRNSDPYVLRKHAILLADAGVDFIVFDCTNGNFLWQDAYEAIFEGFHQARELGIKTPQIAFMLNFAPFHDSLDMLRALYQNLYRPGRYSDLWFRWDGKPMIMAYPECLPAVGACEADTKMLNEIREFFTFRPGQPGYGCGPNRPDHWGWLEIFPQHKYCEQADGSCEMVTVGVAQNANDNRICTYFNDKGTYGRSYTKEYGHTLIDEDSYKFGFNFQEQWERALDLDPEIIFITGWNEWQMGRFHDPWVRDPDSTQIAFVDQFDREHSRDIEPDCDGYLDTYYLQMVHNIRRFKGAARRETPSLPKTIDIARSSRQFSDVAPEYKNHVGSAVNRDFKGYGSYYYKNDTARNNFVSAKVARDDKNIYFYVKCADDITKPGENGNWMTLYLRTDKNSTEAWEGYNYVINRLPSKRGFASVEKYKPTSEDNSYTWDNIGSARIRVRGNVLMLELPRNAVELEDKALNFEFKWSDNMQKPEIMDFYANGDTAPTGRFNYLFKE